MFSNFFFENRSVYGTMWKNIVEPDKLRMTIWHTRITCWIPKATNTSSTKRLQERASVLRYVHITCYCAISTNTGICLQILLKLPNLSFDENLSVTRSPYHRSAAISLHCVKSCVYSQKVLLKMGEFVARNMLSWFKKINKRNLLHHVGCLRCCSNDARSHKRQV